MPGSNIWMQYVPVCWIGKLLNGAGSVPRRGCGELRAAATGRLPEDGANAPRRRGVNDVMVTDTSPCLLTLKGGPAQSRQRHGAGEGFDLILRRLGYAAATVAGRARQAMPRG